MGATLFWDVDTQHDFIDANGKLSVPNAIEILPNLHRLTNTDAPSIIHAGSVDAHTPQDREFRVWPEHCVYGTPGQQKVPDSTKKKHIFVPSRRLTTRQLRETIESGGQILFEKQQNDVATNPNVKPFLRSINPEAVVIYGVATDYCVDLAARYVAGTLGYNTVVLTDAIKEIDRIRADRCISSWETLGVKLRKTSEYLNSLGKTTS